MDCIAFPAAPLIRLSIAPNTTILSTYGSIAKPTSAKFDPIVFCLLNFFQIDRDLILQ
jgi:hypothetical protein